MIMMWTVVAMYSGFFVGRFFLFHFWEDLLFAASVALAWGLYLLQARQLPSCADAALGAQRSRAAGVCDRQEIRG
jgi:hypothetical protein